MTEILDRVIEQEPEASAPELPVDFALEPASYDADEHRRRRRTMWILTALTVLVLVTVAVIGLGTLDAGAAGGCGGG